MTTTTTDALGAPQLDPALLEELVAGVVRSLRVNRIAAASGQAGSIRLDRVEIGDASVGAVKIRGLSTRINCGAALLKNVRAILEIHFEVRWSYDLKWFGSDSGIKTLGSKAKPIPLHDIRIPMLQDIAVDVPEATVTDLEADVQDVTGVALGGGRFENLEIDDTRLPSAGFTLSGMNFASAEIESFGVPSADSKRLTIGNFSPDQPVALPDVEIRGVDIPEVAVPEVTSDGAVSIMDIDPEDFEAPMFKIGDLFKAVFVARPILHLQIGELVLTELTASARVDALRLEGTQAPVAVHGIELGALNLDQLTANGILI